MFLAPVKRQLVLAALFVAGYSGGSASAPTPTEIVYGPDPAHMADIYPAAEPNSPVVIAVHGGAWIARTRSDMARYCLELVASGFACMSVDYRLAPHSIWPAQLEDMALALAWERNHLADLNGSTWLAWWGSSAGGQIALMAAYKLGSDAVIGWSAPTDLLTMKTIPEASKAVLGCRPADCADRARSASPALNVTATPTLIVHSVSDPIVDYGQASEIALVNGEKISLDGSLHADGMFGDAWTPSVEWLKARLLASTRERRTDRVRRGGRSAAPRQARLTGEAAPDPRPSPHRMPVTARAR